MRHTTRCTIIVSMVLAASFLSVQDVSAQGWQWPEDRENLKVLSDTISPGTLSRIMRGFTGALGVRCEHCHVGDAGMPLSEFDFAADDKRPKRVAREMLRMVRTINTEVIAGIEEPSGRQVACFTCHRGQAVPPQRLDQLLIDTLRVHGVTGAMDRYDELRREHFGTGVYNFGPRTFTRVADRLLDEERSEDAIVFLLRGIEEYPDDSLIPFYLGRAYLAEADTILARHYFEQAVVRDPESQFFRRSLESLLGSH